MNVVDLFLDIVKINSESYYEDEMINYIIKFLKNRNLEYYTDSKKQIYTRIDNNRETLLFCSHLDTVAPGKNINPEILTDGTIKSKNDTILGADNKASVANMLILIDKMYKNPEKYKFGAEFCFTVQEEVIPCGAKSLNFNWFKSKIGFIFDVSNLPLNTMVKSAPFINDLVVEIKGKSAHCSRPYEGINALVATNLFLSGLNLGSPYPGSTLNIGLINGGDATNTIPGYIKLCGDFRAGNKQLADIIKNDVYNAAQNAMNQMPGCEIVINCMYYSGGYNHNINSLTVKHIENVYKISGFDALNFVDTNSGSDANTLNNSEKDLIVYCMADGVNYPHTTNENINIETLKKLGQIMENLVMFL